MNYFTAEECEEVGLKTTRPSSPESGDIYVDIPKGQTFVFFMNSWGVLESADKTIDYFMATKEKYFEDNNLPVPRFIQIANEF